jgi:hypothetical protein
MRARLLIAMLLIGSTMLSVLDTPTVLGAPANQSIDPGAPGPRAVTRTGYDGGDTFFLPSGWSRPIEFRARVQYPTDLGGGPLPIIFLLHGQHGVCYAADGTFQMEWPCTAGFSNLPNFLGYDYLGDHLASQGFIVVSISANGINAHSMTQSSDRGMRARAELIIAHLQVWANWNATTNGTFGSLFTGRVNMNAVGLMGHSRGGEGAVRAYELNTALGSPFGIRAVFPLAPVDTGRPVINNVPLAVLLPYCDGDVSALEGVHFYDDARYNLNGDSGPKHMIVVMGANHNFYNTIWTPNATYPGGSDDWLTKEELIDGPAVDGHCTPGVSGNVRLGPDFQRATATSYMSTFFRVYLRGETGFAPILHGDMIPPSSARTTNIRVSYHAPATPATRRDVNRYLAPGNIALNDAGGIVATENITFHSICGGDGPQPKYCLPSSTDTAAEREPHSAPSLFSTHRGAGQASIQWQRSGNAIPSYVNTIAVENSDVSGFARLQFRVSTVWGHPLNPPGAAQAFRVILTDGAGRSAAVSVTDHSDALYYPPGSLVPVQPKSLLNMARIPLSAFRGIALTSVRSIEFRFDQTATGWLLLTDLAFANAVPAATPTIDAVTPSAGAAGGAVSIFGTNLTGASAVRFNGVSASFTTVNESQITAVVPGGATTGPVTVTTGGGTATSPTPFTVVIPPPEQVRVQVVRQGPALAATFTARPSCERINQIVFGNQGSPFNNARVSIVSPAGPGVQTTGFTYSTPPGTTSVTALVERLDRDHAATVTPIQVVDGCGAWQTFVGGGTSAWN